VRGRPLSWPLQDIRSLQSFLALFNLSLYFPLDLHCSHDCNTIARLMPNMRPPTLPPLCFPYTIQYWQWQYRVKVKLSWPLQDILSRIGCRARINDHCIAPPTYIAHTVAILLHYYYALFNPLPTQRFHAIHHTILCIAISFKG